MKLNLFVFLISSVILVKSEAADLGFRFKSGRCVNDKNVAGYNPGFVGPCGDLRGSLLGHLNFDQVDLSGVQFQQAELEAVSFKGATLDSTNFKNAQLRGVSFEEAILKSTDFTRAVFANVSFAEALIENVNFSYTDMSGMALSFLDCQNCSFVETNLSKSVLDNARLIRSDFTKANLRGTIFKSTDVKDAIFKGAVFNKRTVLPFDNNKAKELGLIFLSVECNPLVEVEYRDQCFYLDGSGGRCEPGYELAPQSIFAEIAANFVGLGYKIKASSNCCIWHKDVDTEGQDYGFNAGQCNLSGPFKSGPELSGSGCSNANIKDESQLTFCRSIDANIY